MTYIITAVAFILLLTLLIIIHELGHYCIARLFKIEVEEFGFGLPPRAATLFTSGATKFTLNWVPFGGFVRLKGENEIDTERRFEKGSFASASIPARILVLVGGVAMNLILAFILFTIGFGVGQWVPFHYTSQEQFDEAKGLGELVFREGVFIQDVIKGGSAEEAGIQPGSEILMIDESPVQTPGDVIRLQEGKTGIRYTVLEPRSEQERNVTVELREGKSGIALASMSIQAERRPLQRALVLAGRETAFMTMQTFQGLWNLFHSLATRFNVPEGITGIIGIYGLTSSSVQEGFMTYLRLVALLSLSLAILNILPLPALDGGRLLFVLVEMVIRRPINQRFELMTNAIGFLLLILLIVIITFNDVLQLF